MSDLPAHVTVTDQTIRHLSARCWHCKAQVDFGQYADPGRVEELLAQWVDRHRHKDWS